MNGSHIGLAAAALLLSALAARSALSRTATSAPADPARAQPLRVVYFYSPTCEKCREAAKVVDAAERRYARRIRVERMNVQDRKVFERMLEMEDQYGSNEPAPPKVFVGSQYLAGVKAISERLDKVIAQELTRQGAAAASQPASRPAPTSRPSPPTRPAAET